MNMGRRKIIAVAGEPDCTIREEEIRTPEHSHKYEIREKGENFYEQTTL